MTTSTAPDTTSGTDARAGSSAAVILGIGLAIFVAALCVNPVPESDLFWQLRTGELIVHNHQAPHSDIYSWTRHGTPWVAHEWLSFVILWTSFHLAGFGGLYLLTAAVALGLFTLQYRLLLRQTNSPLISFALACLAALTMAPFLQPRPQLATYLFSLMTLSTILSIRSGQRTNRIFLLVPLFALWANLHAGVLIGLALLVIFAIGEFVGKVTSRESVDGRPVWLTLLGAALACFAATLLTPYSYHEYQNILSTITNSTAMNIVAEWASPDFHQPFGRQVEILIVVLAYGMFFSRLKRGPSDILLILILIHEALNANRNVPLLAILGTVIAASHIQSALTAHLHALNSAGETKGETPDSLIGERVPSTIAALIAVCAAFYGIAQASGMVRSFGPSTGSTLDRIGKTVVVYGTYPDHACAFIEKEQFPSTMRMFNIYGDGGFLTWRMPDRPVFIDSRADVYFGKTLEDYRKVSSLRYGWRDILAEYGVDMIVVSASERQALQYLPAPDWALVYLDYSSLDAGKPDDGQANTLILIKREPQYAGLIDRCRRDCPAYAGARRENPDWASLQ